MASQFSRMNYSYTGGAQGTSLVIADETDPQRPVVYITDQHRKALFRNEMKTWSDVLPLGGLAEGAHEAFQAICHKYFESAFEADIEES